MYRISAFSKACAMVTRISRTNLIPLDGHAQKSYATGTFAATYTMRPSHQPNRIKKIPFFDPYGKRPLIPAHVDKKHFFFIKPKRPTESILEDFRRGGFAPDHYAFGTLLYNDQIDAAWEILKQISTRSSKPIWNPRGLTYGMFMEYLKYPRNFKGMIAFSKELESRNIPICSRFYQNLFLAASYEKISDIKLLNYWYNRARSQLGNEIAFLLDKIINLWATIDYQETLKLVDREIESGVKLCTASAIAIMKACLIEGDKENLMKYYNIAIKSKVKRYFLYGLLIQFEGLQENNLKEAYHWFKLIALPTIPPQDFVNSMALVLIEHRKFDEAVEVLSARERLNSMSIYLLMKVHYIKGDYNKLVDEMQYAYKNRIRIEAKHYNLVFSLLYRERNNKETSEKVWKYFEEMLSRNIHPSSTTYDIILNTLQDLSQGSKALEDFVTELMRRSYRVDDQILLKQIQAYATEGLFFPGPRVILLLGDENKTFRSVSLVEEEKDLAKLAVLNNASSLDLFEKAIQKCQPQISSFVPRYYVAIISGYARFGLPEKSVEYFESYAERNKPLFSNGDRRVVSEMLNVCSSSELDMFEIARDCTDKYGLKPFRQFYEIQMQHFARLSDETITLHLYEQMNHNDIKPKLSTYITMTYLYAMLGNTGKMQEFFMKAKDHASIRPKNMDPLDKLLQNEELELINEGFLVSAYENSDMRTLSLLFTIVIQGFSRASCFSEAFITYELMKNTQIPIDEVTYTVLIDAIKFSGELSRLETVLADLKRNQMISSANIVTTLIEAFAAAKNTRKIAELAVMAEKMNIIPTTKFVGTFLHLFPKEIVRNATREISEVISPEIRMFEEKPLGRIEKQEWHKYIAAVEAWLNNKEE